MTNPLTGDEAASLIERLPESDFYAAFRELETDRHTIIGGVTIVFDHPRLDPSTRFPKLRDWFPQAGLIPPWVRDEGGVPNGSSERLLPGDKLIVGAVTEMAADDILQDDEERVCWQAVMILRRPGLPDKELLHPLEFSRSGKQRTVSGLLARLKVSLKVEGDGGPKWNDAAKAYGLLTTETVEVVQTLLPWMHASRTLDAEDFSYLIDAAVAFGYSVRDAEVASHTKAIETGTKSIQLNKGRGLNSGASRRLKQDVWHAGVCDWLVEYAYVHSGLSRQRLAQLIVDDWNKDKWGEPRYEASVATYLATMETQGYLDRAQGFFRRPDNEPGSLA